MRVHNYNQIRDKFHITVGGCGDLYDRDGNCIRASKLDDASLFLFREFWREGYGATEVIGELEDRVYYGFYYLIDYEWLEYISLNKDKLIEFIRDILNREIENKVHGNIKVYFDESDKDGYNLVILVHSIEDIKYFQDLNTSECDIYARIARMKSLLG